MDLPSYYYEDEKPSFRKYAEATIPIVIILLIAMVVLGKTTNVFCSVPGLNAVLCASSGPTKILVIGSLDPIDTVVGSANLKALLDGELGTACNMNYFEFQDPSDLQLVGIQLLQKYDIIIATGVRQYPIPVREAIGKYLTNGGNLILVGDAATKDPTDPLVIGWTSYMDVPIKLKTTDNTVPVVNITDAKLSVMDIENPIYTKSGYALNSKLSELTKLDATKSCGLMGTNMQLIDVAPTEPGVLFVIKGKNANSKDNITKTVPALVEKKGLMGGSIYYYAMDPGCTKPLFIATVESIIGRNTCTGEY